MLPDHLWLPAPPIPPLRRRWLLKVLVGSSLTGKACAGGTVLHFVLLTLQRPLIKIPLSVESEPAGRQASQSRRSSHEPRRGGKMLLMSSLRSGVLPGSSCLQASGTARYWAARVSTLPCQAGRIWRDGSHCSLAVPENKEISTQTTKKPPPGVSQF